MTARASGSHLNYGLFIEGLSHAFDNDLGDVVLNDITCSFPRGSFVAILGPSGCGKTTLLRCLAGLIRPTAGEIMLDGLQPQEARRRGHVGCAFQSPTLLPWRNAIQNVLLPLEILGSSNSPKEAARATDLLSVVDLKDHIEKLPFELSGGMQQRVGLARALVTHPSYLFLDEPFGQLDGITRDQLNARVRKLWQSDTAKDRGKITIVFVTHSVEEAVFLANQVVILSPRPARIKEVVEINLPENRDISTRFMGEFFGYITKIRRSTEEPTA